MIGSFTGDRGDFHGEDIYDGRPIRVHFAWYRISPNAARWEQEGAVTLTDDMVGSSG
ncbi:hypothetical protein [Streptomyces sp. NPDC048411]|uniref:hypothetical protein n=1 Tax=Streptomyces sp. NPDC048411 TaxID=3157206 RepID=UPI0034568679